MAQTFLVQAFFRAFHLDTSACTGALGVDLFIVVELSKLGLDRCIDQELGQRRAPQRQLTARGSVHRGILMYTNLATVADSFITR